MKTRPYESPYGIMESQDLVPRWTKSIVHGQVRKVDPLELDISHKLVRKVDLVRDIHAIHSNQVIDDEDAEQLDLDEEYAAQEKTAGRLLIKPRLKNLRSRNNQDENGPENVFSVSPEMVDKQIRRIDKSSVAIRKLLLNNVVSGILGYDIAAGETEAIARDCLKTDIEIDDELVPYIERIGLANIIGKIMHDSEYIPDTVKSDVMKDLLIKWFDDTRGEHKGAKKSQLLRRLKHEYADLVAQPVGATLGTRRGLSEYNKRDNGQT